MLSTDEKKAIKKQIQTEIYKRSFYDFLVDAVKVLEPQTKWSFNWHIKELCDIAEKEIVRINNGIPKDKDIIINVPPRTMKSYIFSICLNAWAWTSAPHLKFMTISYADNLSSKFSYKTRLLIQSEWYQSYFDVKLSDDDNRKTAYSNEHTGTREAFGMTGSVTGSGADVIIVDDPQKPSDTSQTKLDTCVDVYRDTVYNRLNDPLTGIRIIIQQRCSENDLTGYLLNTDAELYHHICLPMELTKDVNPEYVDKYVNDLLWENRFPHQVLAQYSRNRFTYSSQYLQNPIPHEGDLIKRSWLDIKDISPEELLQLKWEMFIDSAYTADIKNDETGCIIAAKYKNMLLIKKVFIWYKEFPELIRAIKLAYNQYGIKIIRIEPKASGLSILQQLRLEGLNITKTPSPKDDKVTRVTSITPVLEGKRVILLRDSGSELLLSQCAAFPNSNKDGLVDCLYYAVDHNLNKSSSRYAVS
jgi:predicted phage terminase large subunit-like protein